MSGALEKFGIYDFMGIWGPGAIAVTYFWFTLGDVIHVVFGFLDVTIPIQMEVHRLIVLYSAVAYLVGVFLHELGKLIVERTVLFDTAAVKNCVCCEPVYRGFGWRIKNEYRKIIRDTVCLCKYRRYSFDKALNDLKYSNTVSTKRIDTYHSVYGMSRSLSICFGIHALVKLVVLICESQMSVQAATVILIDIVLSCFFIHRAYRYFCAWIRNVFIQHDKVFRK